MLSVPDFYQSPISISFRAPESVTRFVKAYQHLKPFSPIMSILHRLLGGIDDVASGRFQF